MKTKHLAEQFELDLFPRLRQPSKCVHCDRETDGSSSFCEYHREIQEDGSDALRDMWKEAVSQW